MATIMQSTRVTVRELTQLAYDLTGAAHRHLNTGDTHEAQLRLSDAAALLELAGSQLDEEPNQ